MILPSCSISIGVTFKILTSGEIHHNVNISLERNFILFFRKVSSRNNSLGLRCGNYNSVILLIHHFQIFFFIKNIFFISTKKRQWEITAQMPTSREVLNLQLNDSGIIFTLYSPQKIFIKPIAIVYYRALFNKFGFTSKSYQERYIFRVKTTDKYKQNLKGFTDVIRCSR